MELELFIITFNPNLNQTKPYMNFLQYCIDYGQIRGPVRSNILDLIQAPQEKQTQTQHA